MKGFSKIALLVVILAILAAAAGYFVYQQRQPTPVINSFEDCVKAGYPVAESYPRQCFAPDGKSFVEQVKRELTSDQCVAEGGEVINTLSQPSYSREIYIGDVTGLRCPCVCLKKESAKEEVDTSTWKTYRNEKYGFEVRYPNDWMKEDGYQEPNEVAFSHGALFGDVKDVYAELMITARVMSKDFIDTWNQTTSSEKTVKIGGVSALKQSERPSGAKFQETKYSFVSADNFYSIQIRIWDKDILMKPQNVDYQKLLNKILSTFKFIK